MKAYLALISAAALALSACSQEAAKPVEQASAPAASVPAAEGASGMVAAEKVDPASVPAECSFVVETGDQMKYNTNQIPVKKSCETFKVTLKHTGSMPVTSMGHNIVITKADDASAVANEGSGAGPDSGYLKADNPAIIAHTDMIGGGQEASLAFKTSQLDPNGSYKFFCTFPAHFSVMQGDVKLVD
ncbi:azurin [Neisseria wadsworthii]|uniref:Azurin n=1 Tax=Neisseria wadsworthii 9715 TaxID=1030841 RepID=G4CQ84_9NEIS|nr:azurin [Neisseria wadsworthii]EGZ46812.1 azurin [Neisseria wadsworthii 9715]QMT35010.1 azurin [Neisseria wadsworthii]